MEKYENWKPITEYRKYYKWTTEEKEFLKYFYGKKHVSVIARKLNRTIDSVALKAKSMNLIKEKYKRL